MNFPVLLKTDPGVRSEESLYYVVASNGVFQVCETETYRAVTRTEEPVPGLVPERESLLLRFPRIPAVLLGGVLAFFRAIFTQHGGEGIVILFYHPETRTYRVGAPRQTIPGYRRWDGSWRAYLRLRYGEVSRPAGCLRFGTIHSHADSSAHSSAIDCADEEFQDGLHVVYGHVDRREPSCSATFVAHGVRFLLDPEDVVEPCRVPERSPDPEWMVRVQREEMGITPDLSPAPRAGSGSLPPGGAPEGEFDDTP